MKQFVNRELEMETLQNYLVAMVLHDQSVDITADFVF